MDAMVIVFIVFMSFVSIMCLFALFVVVRDLLVSDKDKKESAPVTQILPITVPAYPMQPPVPTPPAAEEKREPEPEAEKAEVAATVAASEPEPEPEPEAAEEATAEVAADDSMVKFAPKGRKTLDEAFFELSDEQKGYYNEVARYASAVPTVTKHYKNDVHEEWKVGVARLICMKIRRGAVVCEFNIQNSEMKDHISGSRVAVKQSQTTVKLEDRDSVAFALESIDLAARIIEEEKAEKKRAILERRKEKRKQAKQETSSAAAEEAAATEDAE